MTENINSNIDVVEARKLIETVTTCDHGCLMKAIIGTVKGEEE